MDPMQKRLRLVIAGIPAVVVAGILGVLPELAVFGPGALMAAMIVVLIAQSHILLFVMVGWIWFGRFLLDGIYLPPDSQLGLEDGALAIGVLLFLIAALRGLDVGQMLGDGEPRFRNSETEPSVQDDASLGTAEATMKGIVNVPTLMTGLLAVAGALLLLHLAPPDGDFRNPARLVPSAMRAIGILWGIVLVGWTVTGLLRIWSWRKLSWDQAGTYLQWSLLDEWERDFTPGSSVWRGRRRRRRNE